MEIRLTTNQDDIRRIIFDEDIYPLISEGLQLPRDTVFPTDTVAYIGGYAPSIFALTCVHRYRDGVMYHGNVLKCARRQYGREFLRQSLDMIKWDKIYAEIPLHRKDLFNTAKKLGFKTLEVGEKRVMRI